MRYVKSFSIVRMYLTLVTPLFDAYLKKKISQFCLLRMTSVVYRTVYNVWLPQF